MGHSANVLPLFTPKELYSAQLTNEASWAFPPSLRFQYIKAESWQRRVCFFLLNKYLWDGEDSAVAPQMNKEKIIRGAKWIPIIIIAMTSFFFHNL